MKRAFIAVAVSGLACLSGSSALAASYIVSLQASNSQYMCAEGGGGGNGDVNANRNFLGGWETFILDDLNGGTLDHGDPVAIRAGDTGLFLCANSGGGGDVVVNRIYADSWETWTIRKTSGSGTITGGSISLQAGSGHYLVAVSGGGGQVYANAGSVYSYSTWTIGVNTAPGTFWSSPSYSPSFWNDASTVQYNNNCYNYATNRRTDTFAQPGRSAGAMYSSLTYTGLTNAALADGLEPTTSGATSSEGKSKIAIAVWDYNDFHVYRQDSGGAWSHKPGGTTATDLDDSSNTISDPASADRGNYTTFVGYFWVPSDSYEGNGHANIN